MDEGASNGETLIAGRSFSAVPDRFLARERTGVKVSGAPIRVRQIPGYILVHDWRTESDEDEALSITGGSVAAFAALGSAAAAAAQATVLASERLESMTDLNFLSVMTFFKRSIEVVSKVAAIQDGDRR